MKSFEFCMHIVLPEHTLLFNWNQILLLCCQRSFLLKQTLNMKVPEKNIILALHISECWCTAEFLCIYFPLLWKSLRQKHTNHMTYWFKSLDKPFKICFLLQTCFMASQENPLLTHSEVAIKTQAHVPVAFPHSDALNEGRHNGHFKLLTLWSKRCFFCTPFSSFMYMHITHSTTDW